MFLHPDMEHTARAALALACVSAGDQDRIVSELYRRLDRPSARSRRDYWIRQAFALVSDVPLLADALHRYAANTWPHHRHLATSPQGERPLHVIFFNVCQAAADAGSPIPGARQLRRIVE